MLEGRHLLNSFANIKDISALASVQSFITLSDKSSECLVNLKLNHINVLMKQVTFMITRVSKNGQMGMLQIYTCRFSTPNECTHTGCLFYISA